MICAAKNCTEAEAEKYEIIWYVIKLQHNPGSGWFSRASMTDVFHRIITISAR